jgi:uncharacterized protein
MLDRALPFYTNGDYQTAIESILVDMSDQLVDYVPQGQTSGGNGIWHDNTSNLFALAVSNIPFIIFALIVIFSIISVSNKCPSCGSRKVSCDGEYCVCKICGKRFKKKERSSPFIILGGGGFGGSGGGGFGGGSSGGGGAGR